MKFGGTSVADADAIDRVAAIVRRQLEADGSSAPPIVVVSALAKVTDALIDAARRAEEGDAHSAAARVEALIERHVAVASALASGASRVNLTFVVDNARAREVVQRLHAALFALEPADLDTAAAAGERMP